MMKRMFRFLREFGLRRSGVFDYAYFVNNYGWFLGGKIVAKFGKPAANEAIRTGSNTTLTFSAITHAGSIEWSCGKGTADVLSKYRPTVCR